MHFGANKKFSIVIAEASACAASFLLFFYSLPRVVVTLFSTEGRYQLFGCRQGEGQVQADESERLMSLQFSWGPEKKEVSSIFIGTSPEFELALYTLCFVGGAEENIVTIAGYEVKIRCAHI